MVNSQTYVEDLGTAYTDFTKKIRIENPLVAGIAAARWRHNSGQARWRVEGEKLTDKTEIRLEGPRVRV